MSNFGGKMAQARTKYMGGKYKVRSTEQTLTAVQSEMDDNYGTEEENEDQTYYPETGTIVLMDGETGHDSDSEDYMEPTQRNLNAYIANLNRGYDEVYVPVVPSEEDSEEEEGPPAKKKRIDPPYIPTKSTQRIQSKPSISARRPVSSKSVYKSQKPATSRNPNAGTSKKRKSNVSDNMPHSSSSTNMARPSSSATTYMARTQTSATSEEAPSTSASSSSEQSNNVRDQEWTTDRVKLLLTEMIVRKDQLRSANVKKIVSYREIEQIFVDRGHTNFDAKYLQLKSASLKTTYQRTKTEQNKSGASPPTWQFYDLCERFFANDLTINAGYTIESLAPEPLETETQNEDNEEIEYERPVRGKRGGTKNLLVEVEQAKLEELRKLRELKERELDAKEKFYRNFLRVLETPVDD